MGRSLHKREVVELTTLLRNDQHFKDLRRLLATRGHDADRVVLAGLIDSEENSSLGVFVLRDGTCVLFERAGDGTLLRWVEPAGRGDWEDSFEAVEVAVAMVKAGQLG